MDVALERYQQKRNFKATPEPQGRGAKKKSKTLSFVIQKHAASHLHYDFRLELGGTLKSWAVPKGPSLDPKEKRLAMHVEDHPMDYADFEGTIPEGNYGAGTVIVWDRGEWIPLGNPEEDYASGKLKFELRGTKLHGHWMLVKTRGPGGKNKEAWLLIKEHDDAAKPAAQFNVVEALPDSVIGGAAGKVWKSNRSTSKATAADTKPSNKKAQSQSDIKGAIAAKLPLTLAPQLAMLVDEVPRGTDWSYELKFDGYRILARIDGADVRLFTRNGNDWTAKLKHIAKAIAVLKLDSGWLDGEVVVLGKNDQPNFQALQNAFENSTTAGIQYYLFDVPYLNGFDLREVRLDERRVALAGLLKKARAPLFFSETLDMPAASLFKHACDMQLEGLIGKRKSAGYLSSRSRDWIKLKCLQRQEFVIGGFTDSKRPTADSFGSLLLGVHEPDGKLRYAGRVGTGFSETTLRELLKKMKPLRRDTMPFDEFTGEKPTRAMHWIEPKLVGEVTFSEWTTDGHLRHPSFQGLRTDKLASGITAEKPIAPPTPSKTKPRSTANAAATKSSVTVTHGDRVIDATTGTTKQQLFEFYQEIAPHLLKHLNQRPVSLVRAPNGIDGQLFFQKHLDTVKVANVTQLNKSYFPGHPPLITIDSEIALLSCVQMNAMEFHTWNSSIADGEQPDRMIFDLDPGEGIAWKQIQDAAQLMKVMLDQLKLKSFLKTSGGKGLHVVVPLKPAYDWDTVKGFSEAIVTHLAGTLPTLFVAKSGPRNRVGRIFIDYLRNGLGATTASAFSARARAGLGVSIPVEWDELPDLTGGNHWTIANALERTTKPYSRIWATYSQSHQVLDDAMAQLQFNPTSQSKKPKHKGA